MADDLGAPVTCIRLTADGNCLLAATIGAGIRLIDRASGTHLADFTGHACVGRDAGAALVLARCPAAARARAEVAHLCSLCIAAAGTRTRRWSAR